MLTFGETVRAGWEFIFRITHGWGPKILLAPPVVFYNTVLGGDSHILLAYGAVFLLDLAAGVASALKRRVFSRKRLELWTVKLIVHSLCVLLVGLVDMAFVRALRGSFHPPILDIVVCLLLAGEAGSVLANLEEMTGRVPPALRRFTERVRERAGRRLDDILNPDDDRPEKNDQAGL